MFLSPPPPPRKDLVLKSKDAESNHSPITEKWGRGTRGDDTNYKLTMDFC